MKKLIIGIVSASLLIGSVAVAHTDNRLEHLKETLELSEQQTESIQKIFENSEKQREALQKQMRTLHEESRQQFEAVLNEEQLKKLAQLQEGRRGFKKGHRKGKGEYGRNMRGHDRGMRGRGMHSNYRWMPGPSSQGAEQSPEQAPGQLFGQVPGQAPSSEER